MNRILHIIDPVDLEAAFRAELGLAPIPTDWKTPAPARIRPVAPRSHRAGTLTGLTIAASLLAAVWLCWIGSLA